VCDNGSGITAANYQSLTLKHWTSKLSTFDDLDTLSSFGFRGEALSSLCALAELSVTTRTADDAMGTQLAYDHDGQILSQSAVAREVGTAISLKNLFKPVPVRYKEFTKNVKREYARLTSLLQDYALITPNVKLVVSNQPTAGSRQVVLQTQGNADIKMNILNVYGAKQTPLLIPLKLVLDGDGAVTATGFVSRAEPGCWRSSNDRQHFFVNGRPVELPKIERAINDVYRYVCQQRRMQSHWSAHL
jgi:DNA mismatch repair protein PMS2